MSWIAKITGDGGENLARTLNDLRLLAQAAGTEKPSRWTLADPSAGLSPRPWEVDFQQSTRRVRVRDANQRTVGERTFPKSTTQAMLTSIIRTMTRAVQKVNRIELGENRDPSSQFRVVEAPELGRLASP